MQATFIDVLWLQCHKNQKLMNLLNILPMMAANIVSIYHV